MEKTLIKYLNILDGITSIGNLLLHLMNVCHNAVIKSPNYVKLNKKIVAFVTKRCSSTALTQILTYLGREKKLSKP